MLFRLLGYALPRDAYQQAEVGELIDNLTDKQIGDLAFFGDDEHKITHVGVIVGNNQIIHASGQVRVDLLKPEGIYKKSTKQITHKLRAVKRILPTNYVHTENLFPRKPSVGS